MIDLYTKTIAKTHWPLCNKKFEIKDYYEIEEHLKDCKLAVILVTTYGNGSNMGIKFAQSVGTKNKTKKTHAALFIGFKDGLPMVIEASGTYGIQVVPLVQVIGQRDEVMIRVANPHLLNSSIENFMVKYVNTVIERDGELDIPYDEDHNLEDLTKYDCAELIYHALIHGFLKARHKVTVKPVVRWGKKTYTPIELEFSDLFKTIYDNGWSKNEIKES